VSKALGALEYVVKHFVHPRKALIESKSQKVSAAEARRGPFGVPDESLGVRITSSSLKWANRR
jgi:hypothetical protein